MRPQLPQQTIDIINSVLVKSDIDLTELSKLTERSICTSILSDKDCFSYAIEFACLDTLLIEWISGFYSMFNTSFTDLVIETIFETWHDDIHKVFQDFQSKPSSNVIAMREEWRRNEELEIASYYRSR